MTTTTATTVRPLTAPAMFALLYGQNFIVTTNDLVEAFGMAKREAATLLADLFRDGVLNYNNDEGRSKRTVSKGQTSYQISDEGRAILAKFFDGDAPSCDSVEVMRHVAETALFFADRGGVLSFDWRWAGHNGEAKDLQALVAKEGR